MKWLNGSKMSEPGGIRGKRISRYSLTIRKTLDGFEVVSVSFLLLVILAFFINIIRRLIFTNMNGVNEVGKLMMVWIIYLEVARTDVEGKMIRIEYFFNRFPAILQRISNWIGGVVEFLCLILIVLAEGQAILASQTELSPILRIPRSLFHLPVLVGIGTLLVIRTINIITHIYPENS